VQNDAGPLLDGSVGDTGTSDAGQTDAGPERPLGLIWDSELPNSSYGSPRLFQSSNGPKLLLSFGDMGGAGGGALSIDVSSGEITWQVDNGSRLFTTPVPLAPLPSHDNPFLFGGRSGVLMAIDADNGELLFQTAPHGQAARADNIWNYYTALLVADQTGDGIGEIVVTNGGDDQAEIGDPRPQGWLMVLNGADLTTIHKIPVPAAAETYCTPILWPRNGQDWLVYGTGGENNPGSLFTLPLASVLSGNLDGQVELIEPAFERGSIAPVSLADFDADGVLDLLAIPFDGRVFAISGSDLSTLWSFPTPGGRESAASASIGDFDGDGDLDVFASRNVGSFPVYLGSEERAFDARTGSIIHEDTSSPEIIMGSSLAVDVDGDGKDEVLFNRIATAVRLEDPTWSSLHILHVDEGRIETLGEYQGMIASTGWVGDADGDGFLEWFVTVNKPNFGKLLRYNLAGRAPDHIAWGGYLGTAHQGRY
jgi:outer membrane protein assembly factor BamB